MQIPVLDHGYVELVESWGSDARIIEAARMSTQKGFQGWGPKNCTACKGLGLGEGSPQYGEYKITCPKCDGSGYEPGDEKLLRYLYKHKHMTPFEMAGMTIEVQAPIFVFREWHRHRTQSYNEMSGRYTQLPDLCYVPSIERLLASKQDKKNKQGSTDGLALAAAHYIQQEIRDSYADSRKNYEAFLYAGISKEVARLVLPVAQYSRMRASANLRNWLGFLTLRMDPAAQFEIRQYANIVGQIISGLFPRTWELFSENV